MKLIIGSVAFSLTVFFYCFVLLSVRNPRQHWWTSDNWVANVHATLIVGLGTIGCFALCSAFISYADSIDLVGVLASAGVGLATVYGVRALKIKDRLAEFEKQSIYASPGIRPGSGPNEGGNGSDARKIAA